jgi:hypothetical protein
MVERFVKPIAVVHHMMGIASACALGAAAGAVAAPILRALKQQNIDKIALFERPFPFPGVQPFLLVGQGPPRCFHLQQGKLRLLVFGSLSQEGAVSSIITKNIG